MCRRHPSQAWFAACIALSGLLAIPAQAVPITINWVEVADPGNAPDFSGDPSSAGSVAETFRIMQFEFTNSQYAVFLNAVDPTGTNPFSIYSSGMTSSGRGGITNTGTTNGSRYVVKANMGDKPVNNVSWFDAARVANWLHNGQGSGSTETGAYTLNGQTSGTAPARNANARYYVPTENQWYKAAYYKGGNTNAGYWDYGTQSDSIPTAVTAGPTGIGSAGAAGNFANYQSAADWNGEDGNVTTVGSNGRPSAYAAYDMSGNVAEWNDLTGAASVFRGARGGTLADPSAYYMAANGRSSNTGAGAENDYIGFRLAAIVPEPSTYAMALAGLAGGGFMMRRRRKRT